MAAARVPGVAPRRAGYDLQVSTSGDVLGGRYRLDERIDGGGMGDVWRATDTVLGRGVAVKLLHERHATDSQFQTRFRHEARTMAALHHPGIADVYDYGETDDGAFLVMAHVDGQPLDRLIAEAGRVDPDTTMSIVAQAARALHAAHTAGIVHRDVKPGNLIVKPDGTAVLVDFGVARSADSAALTGAHEVIGTALYIAPEQVSKQATGPATDNYALGAVAYHCLAGRTPFLGDDAVTVAMHHLTDEPPPLPADIPAPVRDLVATALAKDPADRFPSAAAMADAAKAIAGPPDTVQPAAGTAGPHRHPTALAWTAVLLTLTVLGIILALASSTGLPGPLNPPASPDVQRPASPGAPAGGNPRPGGLGQTGSPGQPGGTPTVGGNPPGTGQPGSSTGAPTQPGSTQGPTTQPEPTPSTAAGTPAASPAATG